MHIGGRLDRALDLTEGLAALLVLSVPSKRSSRPINDVSGARAVGRRSAATGTATASRTPDIELEVVGLDRWSSVVDRSLWRLNMADLLGGGMLAAHGTRRPEPRLRGKGIRDSPIGPSRPEAGADPYPWREAPPDRRRANASVAPVSSRRPRCLGAWRRRGARKHHGRSQGIPRTYRRERADADAADRPTGRPCVHRVHRSDRLVTA